MGDVVSGYLWLRHYYQMLYVFFSDNLLWTNDFEGVPSSQAARQLVGAHQQGHPQECHAQQVQARLAARRSLGVYNMHDGIPAQRRDYSATVRPPPLLPLRLHRELVEKE